MRGLLRQLARTDIALADDLAQEAFLRAYKNIRSFRGEARFSTWLYRIAYNCFREDARRRKELVGVDEEQWQAKQDPQTIDPGLRHDLCTRLVCFRYTSATRLYPTAAKTVCRTMKPRVSLTFRSALSKRNVLRPPAKN